MPGVMLQQMPDVRDLRQVDERTEARLREVAPAIMPLHRLKRTGGRPFLFNGATMATICGVTPTLPFWYEVNVHRTVIDSYLTDIRLFHKSADLPDLFWVAEHDDLDAAMEHLERHDPAAGVLPPQELARATSPAELALAIARLQLHVDQAGQHYRALVGELLDALTPKG